MPSSSVNAGVCGASDRWSYDRGLLLCVILIVLRFDVVLIVPGSLFTTPASALIAGT